MTVARRILILCTGNSCRSQMAEGFLKSFDPYLEVHSAGTDPAERTHPVAVFVMREAGIDISGSYPKTVERFLNQRFHAVITVCDDAGANCPSFHGDVTHRLHLPFEDPARVSGTEEEVLPVFRRVRDQIRNRFRALYEEIIERG